MFELESRQDWCGNFSKTNTKYFCKELTIKLCFKWPNYLVTTIIFQVSIWNRKSFHEPVGKPSLPFPSLPPPKNLNHTLTQVTNFYSSTQLASTRDLPRGRSPDSLRVTQSPHTRCSIHRTLQETWSDPGEVSVTCALQVLPPYAVSPCRITPTRPS